MRINKDMRICGYILGRVGTQDTRKTHARHRARLPTRLQDIQQQLSRLHKFQQTHHHLKPPIPPCSAQGIRKTFARHSQDSSKCPQDSLLGVSQNAEEMLLKTMRGTPELLKLSPRTETRRSMIMPPCINPESGQLMTTLVMVVVMMATTGCS